MGPSDWLHVYQCVVLFFDMTKLEITYCRAQPKPQLSWTELALLLIYLAARLPRIVVKLMEISKTFLIAFVGLF